LGSQPSTPPVRAVSAKHGGGPIRRHPNQHTKNAGRGAPYDVDSLAGPNPKLRRFFFTWNNYTDEQYEWITKEFIVSDNIRYLCVAKETAPTTGTKHLQGCFSLRNRASSITALLKKHVMMKNIRLFKQLGTDEEVLEYCSKEDKHPFVYGLPAKETQGTRSDLSEAVALIQSGMSVRALARETNGLANTFVRYNLGLTKLSAAIRPLRPDTSAPLIFWLYGSSGVGKTTSALWFARTFFGEDRTQHYWVQSGDMRWFAAYESQPCVIFDEFRLENLAGLGAHGFSQLLTLLDTGLCYVQDKNLHIPWAPYVIIFTCPNSPDQEFWDVKHSESLRQFNRRIEQGGGRILKVRDDDLTREEEVFGGRVIPGLRPLPVRFLDGTTFQAEAWNYVEPMLEEDAKSIDLAAYSSDEELTEKGSFEVIELSSDDSEDLAPTLSMDEMCDEHDNYINDVYSNCHPFKNKK